MQKPKPLECPYFSCGPTNKPSGWKEALIAVEDDYHFRSRAHRSAPCIAMTNELLQLSQALLGIPEDYHMLIFNDSNTHAITAALWSMLGSRPVDVFHAGAFGNKWKNEISELKPYLGLPVNFYGAPYWESPQFKGNIHPEHDTVIVWNETSAGTCVPDHKEWLSEEHDGLMIVDATSWLFAMPFPWEKADIVTWSLQKAIGGEAIGLMAVSPRAQKHLKDHRAPWAVPQLFQMRAPNGDLNPKFMRGNAVNTPTLSGIADSLACLRLARDVGLEEYHWRVRRNFTVLRVCLQKMAWLCFAVEDANVRSPISVTLKFTNRLAATEEDKKRAVDGIVNILKDEKLAYDFANYPSAPTGFRIWCGPTVAHTDIYALFDCLRWAWQKL